MAKLKTLAPEVLEKTLVAVALRLALRLRENPLVTGKGLVDPYRAVCELIASNEGQDEDEEGLSLCQVVTIANILKLTLSDLVGLAEAEAKRSQIDIPTRKSPKHPWGRSPRCLQGGGHLKEGRVRPTLVVLGA